MESAADLCVGPSGLAIPGVDTPGRGCCDPPGRESAHSRLECQPRNSDWSISDETAADVPERRTVYHPGAHPKPRSGETTTAGAVRPRIRAKTSQVPKGRHKPRSSTSSQESFQKRVLRLLDLPVSDLGILTFEFVSDFDIRASSFAHVLPIVCLFRDWHDARASGLPREVLVTVEPLAYSGRRADCWTPSAIVGAGRSQRCGTSARRAAASTIVRRDVRPRKSGLVSGERGLGQS